MAFQKPLRARGAEKAGADLSLGRSKALVPLGYTDLDLLKASFQVMGMNTWG